MIVDHFFEKYSKYAHALTKEERDVFEEVKACPRRHVGEIAYQSTADVFEVIALSVFLEQQKKIREQQQAIHELRTLVATLVERCDALRPSDHGKLDS